MHLTFPLESYFQLVNEVGTKPVDSVFALQLFYSLFNLIFDVYDWTMCLSKMFYSDYYSSVLDSYIKLYYFNCFLQIVYILFRKHNVITAF